MARVILHIDLNAFFASCEEIKNPDLKEFPVAVGSTSKRGVISTANMKQENMVCIVQCQFMRLCVFVQT